MPVQTPFEWQTPEAIALQTAIKEHLGKDAFFDIEMVKDVLSEAEPLPERIKPEFLQAPRRLPEFPFDLTPPRRKSIDEQIEDARAHFEGHGFTYQGLVEKKLLFISGDGHKTWLPLQ